MADDILFRDKLPLQDIDGHTCLTECYSKERTYINPVTLLRKISPTENRGQNTCAINPFLSDNSGIYNEWGICRPEDNITRRVPSVKESILLSFIFNPRDFIKKIYDINSFNQVITWTIENPNYHFETIKRVHNIAWKTFGIDIENISEIVLDFYYEIAKNNWLKDYINIIKNKYSFDILSEKEDTDITTISNIIIKNFFIKSFFVNIVKKYIEVYSNEWKTINSHYGNLKKFTYKCLIKNIKYKNSNDSNENIKL